MEIGFKGIALPERLADEGEYYFRTKSHRDIENITRCDASRGSVGYVPGVYWLLAHAEFNVFWYDPDSRSVDLRSRPVSC
jgi:hypothetical protein